VGDQREIKIMENRIVIRDENNEVIGWVDEDSKCENPTCKRHIKEGLTVHAIPRNGSLPCYHFASVWQAITAIEANSWQYSTPKGAHHG
jgi:hypothetical protein